MNCPEGPVAGLNAGSESGRVTELADCPEIWGGKDVAREFQRTVEVGASKRARAGFGCTRNWNRLASCLFF